MSDVDKQLYLSCDVCGLYKIMPDSRVDESDGTLVSYCGRCRRDRVFEEVNCYFDYDPKDFIGERFIIK